MSQESVFTRLPHSQYCPRQSSPTVSAAGFDENPGSAPDMQEENGVVTPNTTKPVADAENTQTESSNITLPDSEPNNMKSWTLAQLRSELARVVVQKQAASGQERAILEIRRLALIDRVSITERTEEKKRDASRRGTIPLLKMLLSSVMEISLTLPIFQLSLESTFVLHLPTE